MLEIEVTDDALMNMIDESVFPLFFPFRTHSTGLRFSAIFHKKS